MQVSVTEAKGQSTELVRHFGDCFAYQLAKEHSCPLLYVGEDFDRADVERVL